MRVPHIITATSIAVVIKGQPYTLTNGHANFKVVKAALGAKDHDESKLLELVNVPTAVASYSEGKVSIKDGTVYYRNAPMANYCTQKILEFMEAGLDYRRLMRFFDNLMLNPSARAVNELYKFLEHKNMPLTDDGCFLAYKGVKMDFYSITGGDKSKVIQGKVDDYGHIYNGIGETLEVMRNYVNDDATQGCAAGLHAGSHSYASDFGRQGRLLIVKINPADVVSVPTDCNCQKLRTAKYVVVSEVTSQTQLPHEFSDEAPSESLSKEDLYIKALRDKANSQKRDASGRFV